MQQSNSFQRIVLNVSAGRVGCSNAMVPLSAGINVVLVAGNIMRKQCADHIRASRPRTVSCSVESMFALIKCHYGNSTLLLFSAMTVPLFSPVAAPAPCKTLARHGEL